MPHMKNALIVGGGSGMGRAAAQALHEAGCSIHVADCSLASCREWIEKLKPGSEFYKPSPLFKKLDESVIEEERSRLGK